MFGEILFKFHRINVGRMLVFYRLYCISSSYEFVGTCEYYSWFLATRLDQLSSSSSAPFPPLFPLDLVSPLSVEQRPDVRRGVHHAGEPELALVGLLCCLVCPAFLAFVWLWPTVKIKVSILLI